MDPRRFDALARRLGGGMTRRRALAALAALAGGTAALPAGRQADAQTFSCSDEGCACATGTLAPCNNGLVCCPLMSGIPGAPGVCVFPTDCGGPCRSEGSGCGDTCGVDGPCDTCCSGYCNSMGYCGDYRCTGLGCACASGTYMPCDVGLSCCSSYPGMPGAQGTCQYDCGESGAGMSPVGSSMP
ncbi:MAG: hypothetical protein ACKOWF_00250 [Chloroflexota bacterium]